MRKTGEREGQIKELVGGQNPSPEAPSRNKKRPERRSKDVRSDCQWSVGEGWVCQDH